MQAVGIPPKLGNSVGNGCWGSIRVLTELSVPLHKELENTYSTIPDKEFYFSVLKNSRHDVGLPFYFT